MSVTNFEQDFVLVRDAKVNVEIIHSASNKEHARIIVNDQFVHDFKATSAITDAAITNGIDAVRETLSGGAFFFNKQFGNDSLINYRTKNQNYFLHDDDGIANLIEHVGFTTKFPKNQHTNSPSRSLRLQNVHSNVELNLGSLGVGGEMKSELSFAWDPFQSHIRAVFQLIRMICSNGMVGLSDFINCRIPIVNEWVEHMRIANKQIQNKVESLIHRRSEVMINQRATIRDCQRIVDACQGRLAEAGLLTPEMIVRLKEIQLVCDPELHCKNFYNASVFQDRRLSEQAASHLTQFTVWNMATEMATHTMETSGSSNMALQKLANELLIDRTEPVIAHSANKPNVSVKFNDLDAAFAGNLIVA